MTGRQSLVWLARTSNDERPKVLAEAASSCARRTNRQKRLCTSPCPSLQALLPFHLLMETRDGLDQLAPKKPYAVAGPRWLEAPCPSISLNADNVHYVK